MKLKALSVIAVAAWMVAAPGGAEAQVWTGPYVGAFGGYTSQKMDQDETLVFDTDLDGAFRDMVLTIAGADAFSPGFCGGAATSPVPSGGCGEDEDRAEFGFRAGYDWQAGAVVAGVLGEYSRARITDSVTGFSTTPAFYTMTRELEWLAAIRGRVGVGGSAVLAYATAGAVRGSIDHAFTTSNRANTFTEMNEDGTWGYQAGGGVEFRLSRLTVGAEYLFTSLDDSERATVRAQGPAPATNPFILRNAAGTDLQRVDPFDMHSVRATVGLRF